VIECGVLTEMEPEIKPADDAGECNVGDECVELPDEEEETLEQASVRFEEYLNTMQKWISTDVPNDPWALHRAQTNMSYTLVKMGGCVRYIVSLKSNVK
jgi:hypothetical protein